MARSPFTAANQQLQQWTPKESYVKEAQSWFTGQNMGGTKNGWQTPFVQQYVSSWDKALNSGTARSFFDTAQNPNVTGVATWDHTTESGDKVKFGDIYEDGKKVGNVYDDHDKDEANLMMAPWLLTGDEQRRTYEKAIEGGMDNPDLSDLDRQITDLRERNRVEMPKAFKAAEQQKKVKETQSDIQGGFGDELLGLLGGGAGGAALGFGAGGVIGGVLGTIAGPAGTAAGAAAGAKIGTAVGTALGATGGLLNKDEISEQAARSYEQTKMSWEDNNPLAALGTTVSQAGAVAGKTLQPAQNLSRGLTDLTQGDVGDGTSERFRQDKKGESTAPTWSKVLDVGATVTDGLLQFMSPAGKAAYFSTMGAQVGGEAAEFATTLGASYNPRSGSYENTFLDEDGGFDPVSGLAGTAKIGIDAVQLAGWKGLANTYGARGAAAAEGRDQVEMSGHRFILDDAGRATGVQSNRMALLAPSEQIAWASTKAQARLAARKEGRDVVSPDDLYRAANNLANGTNKLKTAMVNSFGEAYEEGVQAVLEPLSHDGRLSGDEIGSAILYGGAGGLGMSLGATMAGPSRDVRLMNQAYAIESVRQGQEADYEKFKEQWAKRSDQEKRVLASRTRADAAMGQAATRQMAEDRVATMMGTELDAAKAEDAKRTRIVKELSAQNPKTDMFTVMSGQLSAGEVSRYGTALGDTGHAEAVDMSALTVHKALDQRLTGLDLQARATLEQVQRLEVENPQDERLAPLRDLARHLALSQRVGTYLLEDVRRQVEEIYSDATDEATARRVNRQLNGMLEGYYETRLPVSDQIEGAEGTTEDERRDAAAYFVSLIQSREPKLDAGSYVSLVPRSSWELTSDRADDFIQVSSDILQAINGDFDGDKLRGEHQLVLSRERYRQIRSGQTLAGAETSIDIGTRQFDEGFTQALARGLAGPRGAMKDAADAAMTAIHDAVENRYAALMSPAAFDRVWKTFSREVAAGSEKARNALLDALAAEASEAINDLGSAQLRNEWLWVSKVVRANFQTYQRSYRSLIYSTSAGPSATADVVDVDTPEGKTVRKRNAVTDAQTLAMFAVGNTLFRKFQKIHYTWYNAPTVGADRAEKNDLQPAGELYEELARNITRSMVDTMGTDDSIAGRVMVMLSRIVESAMEDELLAGRFSPGEAMALIANMKTKDVWRTADGTWAFDGADMSVLQVVLKRALDQDRDERGRSFDRDEKVQARHARLRQLTFPNSNEGERNAEQAFIEVFAAIPFQDSMAGKTGALAPQTTPEQWLRTYRSLDQPGRREMERLLKNIPEYLDRKEDSNLPYSLKEMEAGKITAYRSAVDAMIATGRADLTFDEAKMLPGSERDAFSGRQAMIAKTAEENFVIGHKLIREAMLAFRKTLNRQDSKRLEGAELAQEMFRNQPARGREILAMFPDAMANAIFTTDSATGRTEVAKWVYGLFEIEDSDLAVFTYWSKLKMQSYFSKLETLKEVDPKRAYQSLDSRFDRLLFRLAQEPGQMHLELVIRKLESATSLWEFFGWLNTEPGIRQAGREPVFLPFNDDVADFEADVAGGWTTARSGGDLREALAKMRTGAKELASTMNFRETKHSADTVYLDSIIRAHTDDPTADDTDRSNLRKLEKAISVSQQLPRGFAPSAMLALTRGAMDAFAEQSHDKGRTPAPFEAHGEFQAIMDAFGFVPGTERIMEVVDAHSISSLRTNISDLARTTGTAMTAQGVQVEWDQITTDQAIELLKDARTAPLAHALLTPTAIDVTPSGTTERLLMEASLSDLLDDRYYKDLYSDNPVKGKLDQALRGLSLVDSRARSEGGNFPVIRYANALAVAWTSKLGRVATPRDSDRLMEQAYLYTWELVKMVGRIQSTKDLRDAEMIRTLRETALSTLNEQRKSGAIPGFVDPTTGEVREQWIELMLKELKNDFDAQQEDLLSKGLPAETVKARSELLEQQYEAAEGRISNLLDDSMARQSMARFYLAGDDTPGQDNVDRASRQHIADYVLEMANFGSRAPEAALAWGRLADMRDAGVDYLDVLDVGDWDALSRGAMGVHLFDQLLPVASHISIPPFPKGDPASSDDRFFKFLDPSYSWIVTDILDEGSPLTAAATWLHQTAEQPTGSLDLDPLMRTMKTTVLREKTLGTLTPMLRAQLIANEERMDSDSAPPGIAAAGNGQKRQAGLAASTARTAPGARKVPSEELLTRVSFTADSLQGLDWTQVQTIVTPAGGQREIQMGLGQLENRFFASITVDGNAVPLDEGNLGFAWSGAESDHRYRYVSMSRLRPIIERYAVDNGMQMADITVEAEFFHPDSQPAEWHHNPFFEGMSHSLMPDGSESLIATLWSDNAAKIAEDTQWTIDAGKKGLRAIQPFRRPTEEVLAEADAKWTRDHDFAAMLRAKTDIVMQYNDGSGALSPSYWNAQYKHRKLSHIVVGFDGDGNVAGMTAEQVIKFQQENGTHDADGNEVPLPLEGAVLRVLPPDVLRTMVGDMGDQALAGFLDDSFLVNAIEMQPYTGITPEILQRFGAGWVKEPIGLGETILASVGQQRVQTVRTMRTDKDRNVRAERVVFLNKKAEKARAARYKHLPPGDARKGLSQVLDVAKAMVSGDRRTFNLSHLTGGVMMPRDIHKAKHSSVLLENLENIVDFNAHSRGFTVVDSGITDYAAGTLVLESLSEERDLQHTVVREDLALVSLESFMQSGRDIDVIEDRVTKALEYLTQSGATVVLGPGPAASLLRDHAAREMEALGYVPVAGSHYIFQPAEFSIQTQNERALQSTLTETRRFKPNRNAVTLLAIDPVLELDENSAVLNPDSTKLRDRKLVKNLVPSSWASQYNIPLEDNRNDGLYARTRQHLISMTRPDSAGRAALLAMAGPDPKGLMPIGTALQRFHDRITKAGSLAPVDGDRLEVGDIIPFVNSRGETVLYRHGFKLPRFDDLTGMYQEHGIKIALAQSQSEPGQTKNSGTLRWFEPRVGYGYEMVLDIPLQRYGDKVQLEWNGMKYVVVPPPEGFRLPKIFGNGLVADLLSDLKSALSKEAHEGRVNNYRNALAFFSYDFTDDITEFFFPDPTTRGPEARITAVNLLHRLAADESVKVPMEAARELSLSNVAVADVLGSFAQAQSESIGVDPNWLNTLVDSTWPQAQIGRALVFYAMTHGSDIDSVIKSSGFSHSQAQTDSVETRHVPGIFADLLDHGFDSAIHKELIERFDKQLLRGPDGAGLRLKPNWQVEVHGGSGATYPPFLAYLQFGEAHSSGDNPELDRQAYDDTDNADVSLHNALAAGLSVGATTVFRSLEKSQSFSRSFTREGKTATTAGEVWDALITIPNLEGVSNVGYNQETPWATARRAAARQEITGFFEGIDDTKWDSDEQAAEYNKHATEILDRMNLYGKQRFMVDSWVRQMLGRPYEVDPDGTEHGVINGRDAVETARLILKNVKNNDLPTKYGRVPLIDINFLTTVYMKNVNRDGKTYWAPDVEPGVRATSWDEWVDVALGTAFDEKANRRFDQVYLLAVDGYMHGYQGATTSTRDLPVSSDSLVNQRLYDEETNSMFVSISTDENLLATDPTLWNSQRGELEDMLGAQRIYSDTRTGPDPSSAQGVQEAKLKWWRQETHIPEPTRTRVRGVRAAGNAFVSYSTKTNRAYRMMFNLRVGNTMLNLPLIVSAPIEAWYRRTFDVFTKSLTTEAIGPVGRAQTRILERIGDSSIGAVAQQIGLEPTYTSEQLKRVKQMVGALASQQDFKQLVYKELMYQYPSMPGIGKIEKWLETYAKFGAKLQDPSWGMIPKNLSRIYLETAMRHVVLNTTGDNVYSIDRMLTEMVRNPEWLKNQDLDAHNEAIAAIANIRSTKPTMLSLAWRGVVEPMSENPHFVPNTAGNFLKLLGAFQNFWANFMVNTAGLQGVDTFAAMWFDGKKKSKLTRRMQAAIRGEEFDPENEEIYDMSEVLESMDLADAFIRGGVSHAALFAFGMMAGGVGLGTGEDDEQKFRRRQAELQGVPVLYDPRDIANDFRNKDAIYLDWLPFGMDSWFKVNPEDPNSRSMAQMNWIARTFLSPVIGMERFFQTGDPMEIVHGFKDAMGAHPIMNEQLWDVTMETVADLHNAADGAAAKGDQAMSMNLLTSMVVVMERMLFENAMVNVIYQGLDDYDRDPWVEPLTDSDGTLQRDFEGNSRPQNLALATFYENGKLKEGYASRRESNMLLHQLSENRFTIALIGSLFDGGLGQSDFWRYNMPIKERTIEREQYSQEEAEAFVKAAQARLVGRQANITPEELLQTAKNLLYDQARASGVFNDNVDAEAWALAKEWSRDKGRLRTSLINSSGGEELTDEGARAIFQGLRSGMLNFGDLDKSRGVAIPYEMRERIMRDWTRELVQEGVDLGLDKSTAVKRMKRITQGPLDDPTKDGLADLLFDKKIPFDNKLKYAQLNTTYVMGPDARPWATGFSRGNMLAAMGIVPVHKFLKPEDDATKVDIRGNTVDMVNQVNTGLRGLEPMFASRNIPTDIEIGKAIEKAIEDAAKGDYEKFKPWDKKASTGSGWQDFGNGWRNFGSGWRNFGRRGGGGGYGGGGGGGGGYFVRMNPLPDNVSTYANQLQFINTSNPILRRAFVRRERVQSERGRLKAWQ